MITRSSLNIPLHQSSIPPTSLSKKQTGSKEEESSFTKNMITAFVIGLLTASAGLAIQNLFSRIRFNATISNFDDPSFDFNAFSSSCLTAKLSPSQKKEANRLFNEGWDVWTKNHDYEELFESLNKAGSLCHPEALYDIGKRKDIDGVGAKYIKLSADLGFQESQYLIGKFFECSSPPQQDFIQARKYYELALSQNNNDFLSLSRLAAFYLKGAGIEKNQTKAETYYKKIEEGISQKLKEKPNDFFTSDVYSNLQKEIGQDFTEVKNEDQAKKWFWLAAKNGNSEAQRILGWRYTYETAKMTMKIFIDSFMKA